jgi:amino acid transporter
MGEQKKKIGLASCLALGIGCIIGAGIFGSLPAVIGSVGGGVVFALLGAAFVVILRSISRTYTSAAVPTSGASFMYASKLMHPYVGALISVSYLLLPTMVSLYGILFAMYFLKLFPALALSAPLIGVIVLAVFCAVAWFGNHSTISINNIVVVLLLVTIGLYIVVGIPSIKPENIKFSDVFAPGMTISAFAAAVGVLTSSLSGASSVAEIADDVENPGKNVPLTLILCPAIVCVLYVLMAVVSLGVVPAADQAKSSLADVAQHFFSPALMVFFIIGGPLAAILTSMVPVALACVATIEYSAKQGIFPEFLAKKNKHEVAYWSLFLVSAIAIGICATGATFGVVLTIFSFINTLSELPNTLSPIFAYKKYPKSCDRSSVGSIPRWIFFACAGLGFAICAYLCVEMAKTLSAPVWGSILGVLAAGYVYFFIRAAYLKKRGFDLVSEMAKPYEPWEAKERSLAMAK